MRQLILHIGSHKTGTTAIQHWIAANRDILARRGIADMCSGDEPNAHGFLTWDEPGPIFPKGFRLDNPARFAEALKAIPADRVIVSSENFSFFVEGKAIARLAKVVKPLFDEVVVLCYLRRQDRHAVSHHMEGARPGRPPEWELWGHGFGALPQVNPMQALYLDYNKRLAKWEKAFGREALRVRVYDRSVLTGGDIVTDFLDTLGIDGSDCTRPETVNTSLDRVKARIGHMANVVAQSEDVTRTLLRATPNSQARARPGRMVAKGFLAPYLAGNRALNERLGISPLPDLFNDDFDDLPDEPQLTWSDEEFNRAVRAAVTVVSRLSGSSGLPSVEDLRAAAHALAATAPARALRLVEAALLQRPTGKILLAMQAELQANLASGDHRSLTPQTEDEDEP